MNLRAASIPYLAAAVLAAVTNNSSALAQPRGGPQGPQVVSPEVATDRKLFWFATGKDDFLVETSRATVAMFKKHGFEVAYKETEGGHTWINWRDYLNEFAPRLFR